MRPTRIAARDDQEVRVVFQARGMRRTDLPYGLGQSDDLPPGHVAAALGCDLVLDVDASHTGLDVLSHTAHGVDRISETVVGIGNDRHRHGVRDIPRVLLHLVHGDQAGIGHADHRQRGTVARHVDRRETDLVKHARAHRVVTARNEQGLAFLEQRAQPRRGPRWGCGEGGVHGRVLLKGG